MASIHKRTRDKGKKNKPYYIQYFDHEGKRQTAKGFTDKGLTEQLAAKLENEVLLRRRGMIDPAQERLIAIRQSRRSLPSRAAWTTRRPSTTSSP